MFPKRTVRQKGVYFTRDLSEISVVVWMIGLLPTDRFGLFPSSFSMAKSLQRFLYDFIMLTP